MELHAELVHAEAGCRVVAVRAQVGEACLGTALGEGSTAEEAEDRARQRLLQQLGRRSGAPGSGATIEPPPRMTALAATATAAAPPGTITAGPGPSGRWSPPTPHRVIPSRSTTRGASLSPGPAATTDPTALEGSAGAPAGSVAGQSPQGISRPDAPPAKAPDAADAAHGNNNRGTPGSRGSQPEEPQVTDATQPDGAPERQAPDPIGAARPADPETTAPQEAIPSEAPPERDPGEEPPADPEDWSSELAAVELQLRRLGWNREQEALYLQRVFGHPSRSRLTRYSDLLAYLTALEALTPGADPALAAVPLRRAELLAQGDALLTDLGWDADQGRRFLEQQLQCSHRRQLSDAQLLAFNMLLEEQMLLQTSGPS